MAKGGGGGGGGKKGGGGRGAGGFAEGDKPVPPAGVTLDYRNVTDYAEHEAKGYNQFEEYSQEGAFVESLTEAQTDAITAYQGFQVANGERFKGLNAEKVNKALYDKEHWNSLTSVEKSQVLAYKDELIRNLDLVKKYKGDTYRVLDNPVGSIADPGLHSKYEVGKINVHSEFLSTSRTHNAAFNYDLAHDVQMRIRITGKNGRSVELNERAKGFMGEREVLFKPNTVTITTSKKWNIDRHNWDIEITEM